MKKLSIVSGIVGFLFAENICGMPSYGGQINFTGGSNVNGNLGSISNNMENKDVFLPVLKRRFSDGMINPVVRYDWKKRKKNKNVIHTSPGQQQNVREFPVKSVVNEAYSGTGYGGLVTPCEANAATASVSGIGYGGLVTPCEANAATASVQSPINGNVDANMMFLPILRPNNVNQGNNTYLAEYSNTQGNNSSNLLQQQYSYQGFSPLAGMAGTSNSVLNPSFSISEVLQIAEQQTKMNVEKVKREIYQEVYNLEQQNEILKKEIQYYKDNGGLVFPDKVAKLEEQIIDLNRYIRKQDEQHAEEIQKLKDQLHKEIKLDQLLALEQENEELEKKIQYYKNGSDHKFLQEITQFRKQIKELQNQLQEEKTRHESEVKELNEQLKKERELNLTFNLDSGSILKNNK